MGLTDVTDLAYLVPRVVAWTLLWLVALFDAVRHRQTKRRGYQLQRGIVVCLFAYVVQDVLLLSYSSLSRGTDSRKADDVLIAFHVFSDLADSIFMGLLLLIAAGYCITRDNLGPYKTKVLATPAIYFVTKAITDIIIDLYQPADVPSGDITFFDPSTWLVLYIAQVVSLMAFMLALVFIFEIVQREVESITKPQEGIVGARDLENGVSGQEGEESRSGHNVALPPEVTENGRPLDEVYAEVTGEDHDAPKTVEEKIQHRTKVQLMRQFSWAAVVCVGCYVAALIVPLFYYSEPGEEDTAVLVVLILWNCVRWLFLAGLCFIFRVRDTNPYLLLDEEGGLDTDFSSGEVHTELGVLSSMSDKTLEEQGVNRNFSIGDEEDEEEVSKGRARLMARNREKSSID